MTKEELEVEIFRYIPPFNNDKENLDESTLDGIAKYFYEHALKDVKQMVTKQLRANINGSDDYKRAWKLALNSVLDFIDEYKC